MDAQNAVEPASTKPPGDTSLKPSGSDVDQHPTLGPNKTLDLDSVPLLPRDPRPANSRDSPVGQGDDGQDGNSDTETIVLPGKDGYSPSKVRKIKNEDAGEDGDRAASPTQRKALTDHKLDRDVDRRDRDRDLDREPGDRPDKVSMPALGNGTHGGKKKTLLDRPDLPHSKDASSGLSSAPASPPPQHHRRHSPASDSDSDHIRGTSSKASTTERARDPDKVVPHKRKPPKVESEDEIESRKIRRQRMFGSGLSASRSNSNRDPRPNLSKLHTENHSSSNNHTAPRNRSTSPVRVHRRSVSTQHSTHSGNGLAPKKKRVPAPLQSTEYHSDESSASASSHPRSSKVRQLATPATAESMISPAKMAPHKKHLDAHGQTFLARACAKGDYPLAKQRLQERPEDINHADYAGNTPLQIAALNGHEEIVKLLLDAGCNVDCVNNEKETPLMDAVENDHLEVVKLLLAAGVNPRKANAYGEEPIDKIDDDNEDAQEMREVLKEARQRFGQRRRTSEEHHAQDHTDGVSSHDQESPRRSPGPSGYLDAGSRRAGTVRATKTSNHLLYMPMDDKTLRQAAARGDEETVMRILQVRESFDDPESMVNAAKAGHEMVLQLLLALGGANPDPKPVRGMDEEYSTPMLAAIGQNESLKVVKLLLAQNDFDPTRRFKGETYYEIARRRKGPNCEDEEAILKKAYDEYKGKHKDTAKTKPASRRDDPQKELTSNAHKRKALSPARESKKTNIGKSSSTSTKEKRRSHSFAQDEQMSPKRAAGRPKKDIPTIAVSDRETSPVGSKQAAKARRTESEVAASSEGETASKPRRKLVSRKELNGDREKQQQRRTSLASNASSLKEPSSPRETRRDEALDKVPQKATDKLHERTKVLKRDESRDRLSVSGEHTGKRQRVSASPTRFGSSDKEGSDAPAKKRRLDVEGKEKRRKPSVSPDGRSLKLVTSQTAPASTLASSMKASHKPRDEAERKIGAKLKKSDTDVVSKEASKSATSDKSIHVKGEDTDVQMRDVDRSGDTAEARTHPDKENDHGRPSPVGGTLQEAMKKAQERKREYEQETKRKEEEKIRKRREEKERERRLKEEEENRQRLEEEKRQREEEELRKRKEEEERKAKEEEERKKLQEEVERRQREEDERRKRLEEERKRKEDEERRLQEEEARLIRAEEERKKRLEEEKLEKLRREEAEKRKQLEDEQKKREEAERLQRQQVEREAAEEAARLKEEEDRKAREEAERKHREEMERRRAAREAERLAELHRIHMEQERLIMEQERLRLSKLPPVLRWLDESPNPKMVEVAKKFSLMQGVRYDCIRPESTGTADGREQWVLNTHVALLLGEKDLTLSRCKLPLRRLLLEEFINS